MPRNNRNNGDVVPNTAEQEAPGTMNRQVVANIMQSTAMANENEHEIGGATHATGNTINTTTEDNTTSEIEYLRAEVRRLVSLQLMATRPVSSPRDITLSPPGWIDNYASTNHGVNMIAQSTNTPLFNINDDNAGWQQYATRTDITWDQRLSNLMAATWETGKRFKLDNNNWSIWRDQLEFYFELQGMELTDIDDPMRFPSTLQIAMGNKIRETVGPDVRQYIIGLRKGNEIFKTLQSVFETTSIMGKMDKRIEWQSYTYEQNQ